MRSTSRTNLGTSRRYRPYLFATIVALGVLLLQFASTVANAPTMVSRLGVVTGRFTGEALSSPLLFWPLALYATLVVTAHVAPLLIATWLLRGLQRQSMQRSLHRTIPLLGGLVLVLFGSALWNALLFPMSRATPGTYTLIAPPLGMPLLTVVTGLILLVSVAGLIARLRIAGKVARVGLVAVALGALVTLGASTPWPWLVHANPAGAPARRPDVILIGIDSLRPDFLAQGGYPAPAAMPEVERLAGAFVMFNDALTPQARTFVAYMSLLTGRDPINHGARFNLYPRDQFDRKETLGHEFQAAGYHTAYATDETRFANFDESFGFDDVAAPPAGVNDFILGQSLDTIPTNLLSTSPAGRWLLPHMHGNRAFWRTYEADDHVERIGHMVAGIPRSTPAFLAIHFCLPHWPYLPEAIHHRASSAASAVKPGWEDTPPEYARALRHTDDQVRDTLALLAHAGRLDNAIVMLYSDHGESLQMKRERIEIAPGSPINLAVNGHGNRAMADVQHRVVMGMQRFVDGEAQWTPRVESAPVSLVDIAPTLRTLTDLPMRISDGIDLAPIATGGKPGAAHADRMRFVETGLTNAVVETARIDEDAVAQEFLTLYELTPDLRLEISPERLEGELRKKERGVYWRHVGLSSPSVEDCWVFVDFSTRKARCVQQPETDPETAPLHEAICRHFAKDQSFHSARCPVRAEGAMGSRSSTPS
jgi:arylsulfatase A-like enzyme